MLQHAHRRRRTYDVADPFQRHTLGTATYWPRWRIPLWTSAPTQLANNLCSRDLFHWPRGLQSFFACVAYSWWHFQTNVPTVLGRVQFSVTVDLRTVALDPIWPPFVVENYFGMSGKWFFLIIIMPPSLKIFFYCTYQDFWECGAFF